MMKTRMTAWTAEVMIAAIDEPVVARTSPKSSGLSLVFGWLAVRLARLPYGADVLTQPIRAASDGHDVELDELRRP